MELDDFDAEPIPLSPTPSVPPEHAAGGARVRWVAERKQEAHPAQPPESGGTAPGCAPRIAREARITPCRHTSTPPKVGGPRLVARAE
jgi:hypothetical protein